MPLGLQVHPAHRAFQVYKVCQVDQAVQVAVVQKVERGMGVLQEKMVYQAKMDFQAHKVPWVVQVNQVAQERGVSLVLLVLLG